jgi:S-adenosylmethionine:tRNA ribosyltransferase-isomerase
METAQYDFALPRELIAQTPADHRDQSRMLVLHRDTGEIEHRTFLDFVDYLQPGDLLVLNDSRVIRARLYGHDLRSQREFEILLIEENAPNDWWAMMRPAKYAGVGTQMHLRNNLGKQSEVFFTVKETNAEGHRRINFAGTANVLKELDQLGRVPLPPYITRNGNTQLDSERYQTVFANSEGSIAAPTAGLHFTSTVLEQIRSRGVTVSFLTLHVGVGTFAPVKTEKISDHRMHEERFEVSEKTMRAMREAKCAGRRVVAVGTTTVRVLESLGTSAFFSSMNSLCAGRTNIFIYPPFEFQLVDVLLTNFHLPCSTLLMLASAFAAPGKTTGRDLVLKAYTEAVQQKYRFFSYGDAMLIL